jgi:hypothetical protein
MRVSKKIPTLMIFSSLLNPIQHTWAEDKPLKGDPSWTKDAWENFKSPVTTDAKYPLLIGSGMTALLLIFEDQIVDPAQQETIEHKPLGSFSKIGDLGGRAYPNALYVAGMLGYGLLESDTNAKQNASGMFQASLYSILITAGLKYTVREPRPDSSNRDSFPSGHTSAAFSFASYVGCRHSQVWGVAAYSLASFVGFSRINDNKHYLHDVTAGAAIGMAYGIGVCLNENSKGNLDKKGYSLSWFAAPEYGGATAGMTIRY